ncbi:hypothetical protein F5Y15DRAFT_414387 [Xylariaceae sp. FL0016]|nr:hypothetical protein F5Y15DRAFT_414387 [Xylariaceae sp. FL0016]
MEEVYQSERRHLQPSFRGKQHQIIAQHALFWSQPSARDDVSAYRRADASHPYPAVGGTPAKWLAASTPFTHWAGPCLAASDAALLIGNRASFDVAQYRHHHDGPAGAGMSMVHLLCIPRAGLFNGVALDRASAPIIDHMVELFRAAWVQPAARRAVLRHQREAIGRRHRAAPDAAAYRAAVAHWRELEGMIDALSPSDFAFGLHLWPDQSVGHLHLHVIAAPLACRKYSTSRHDEKTKDAFEVRDFIQSVADA